MKDMTQWLRARVARKPRPAGTERMWAMVHWRNGRLRVRRGLPPGLLALFCRISLHFMVEDFQMDGSACRCRRQYLWNEQLWHGPQTERTTAVNEGTRVYWVPQIERPDHPTTAELDAAEPLSTAHGVDLAYVAGGPETLDQLIPDRPSFAETAAHVARLLAETTGTPPEMRATTLTLAEPTLTRWQVLQDVFASRIGDFLAPPVGDLLDRIDHAVDGLCPCGVEPRDGSAYCSYDCEPNIRGQHTDTREYGDLATPMRWRPDLVSEAPNEDLTPVGTRRRPVGGLFRSAFRRGDGTVHLRLDDGHRYVGCDVSEEFQDPDGYSAAWGRLERELTNPRQVVPVGPDPESFIESVLPGLLDFEERFARAGCLDEMPEVVASPYLPPGTAAIMIDPIALHPDHPEYRPVSRRTVIIRE